MTFGRALLLIWLAFHLLTMTVSMAKGTAFADTFRGFTEPYQWRVGVHQNWTMYAPNPRLSTTWVEYTGIRADGTELPLPVEVGRPDPHGWILYYERSGKLERNAVSRKHVRASFVRWYCRSFKEAGDPLARIRAEKISVSSPPPGRTAELGPRETWPERRSKLETWNCAG